MTHHAGDQPDTLQQTEGEIGREREREREKERERPRVIFTYHFPSFLDDVSRLKKIFSCHGDVSVGSESNAWKSLRMSPRFTFLRQAAAPLDATTAAVVVVVVVVVAAAAAAAVAPIPLPFAVVAAAAVVVAAAHYQRRAAFFATAQTRRKEFQTHPSAF